MHPPSWPHTPGDLQIHTHIFNHLGTWLTWNVTFTDSHIHTQTNTSLLKLKSNTRGLPLPLYEVGRREIVTVFQCDTFLHLRQRNKGHNNFPGRAFRFYNTHLPYFKTCFQFCSQAPVTFSVIWAFSDILLFLWLHALSLQTPTLSQAGLESVSMQQAGGPACHFFLFWSSSTAPHKSILHFSF